MAYLIELIVSVGAQAIGYAYDRAITIRMIEELPALQRPGGGLPWYLPALVLARPALLPVPCSRSGCAGGWGLHRRGIQGAGWVMPAIKFFKEKGVFQSSCC